MEILILGPVRLRINAQLVELGSDKERTILAALAVDAGRPVSIENLIVRLWDDAPPDHARDSVHSYISRLRGRLRQAEPDAPIIDRRAHTYVLHGAEERTDWHRFQQLMRSRPVENDAATVQTLQNAESLWHGEPLAGLGGAWAASTRHAMLEQRLRSAVLRITATMRMGNFSDVISELSGLADQRPTDETVQSLLMLAYHGSNRSTEALHVHQRLRQTLTVEYGTRPGTEISRLHQGILARTPAADLLHIRTANNVPVTAVTTVITPRNLPHQPPLVGRTSELRALTEESAFSETASVISLESVTGMAGVGKTALAVHTAHRLAARYPDAQLYLNLRAHAAGQAPLTPTEALAALLRLLGAAADQIPTDLDEQTSLWRHMLTGRRAVIVLDDAAHANQISPLVPDSASCLVIITSRRHLAGIPHARTIPLDQMPTPDAIALFRSFAGHQRTADIRAVRTIVHLVARLPLAIEVVATRFKAHTSWTLTTMADRLSREPGRLAELHTADKSVQRAFDLSYRALAPQQRRAFRVLSLHPGGDFTAAAAAAMLDLPGPDTEQVLEELLSYHLITEPTADRFRYHDLLREYARSLAAADHDSSHALHRMMVYYHRTAAAADRCAYPHRLRPAPPVQQPPHEPFIDPAQAKAWLQAERDNLLAAIDHAHTARDTELAAQLAYNLTGFLEADCHWQEAETLLQRITAHLHHSPPQDPDFPGLAQLALSAVQSSTGAYTEAAANLQHVLAYSRSAHRRHIEAEALRVEGMRRWHLGEHHNALAAFRGCLLIHQENKDYWNQARVTNNIAVVNLFRQRPDEAMRDFQAALAGFAATGDELSSARILNNMGDMYLRKGELHAAKQSFEDSLAFLTEVGNRFDQATARSGLADTLTAMGNPAGALTLYDQSLLEFTSLNDDKSCAQTLIGLGEARHKLGDPEEAIRCQTEGLQFANRIGALPLVAEAHLRLGYYHRTRDSLELAAQHWVSATDAAARAHDVERVIAAQTALLTLQATITTRGDLTTLPNAAHASLMRLDPDERATVKEKLRICAKDIQNTSG
ncbi:BTAD domain-containing putative transcriptional regulator [Streptomyces sp. NPDC051976]|uniref:AfsR/SARP family transcriptional regulator n=1 Tax=Streptomyces sp. NPDC051976 TaxID=3154947 RepID=UPI00342B375D